LRCGAVWPPKSLCDGFHSFSRTGVLAPLPTLYCRGNEQGNLGGMSSKVLLTQAELLINEPLDGGCALTPYTPVPLGLPSPRVHFFIRSFYQAPRSPKMPSLRRLGTSFVTWTLVVLASRGVHGSDDIYSTGWSPNNASMSTHQLFGRQLPKGECNKDTPCVINACCNGQYVRNAASAKLPAFPCPTSDTCTNLGITASVALVKRTVERRCVSPSVMQKPSVDNTPT
jgi:hypothetical protein